MRKLCPKCKKPALPEEKVLDTWATSSLTPKISSGLVKNKIKMPFSLRPQAHDIIRTWAFYTLVRAYYENKIPWKDIMVSGFVTLEGQKMSKKKGNVIEPQNILEKYGADALRFWAASSKLGEDLDYQEKDLVTGNKTITKLTNAANFVFTNLKGFKNKKPKKFEKIDELFLKKLNNLVADCTKNFEEYEYSKAKNETDKFFWNLFSSNYLEIIKKRIYNEKGDKKLSAQYTIYNSLLTILKLMAPIMPFITEDIYQKYYRKNEKIKSIHLTKWPSSSGDRDSKDFDLFIEILGKIRQEKSLNKKSMNSQIILTIRKEDAKQLKEVIEDLKDVANALEIREGELKVDFV